MKISISNIKDKLVDKGLKVTPQRIAILEAIYTLNNHPTAEMIMDSIKDRLPGVSFATIYKVLDVLEEKELIKKVKTDKDIKRYDAKLENHHHLYSNHSQVIKDYINTDLDQLLNDFFKENKIENFEIDEIRLQISGTFSDVSSKE